MSPLEFTSLDLPEPVRAGIRDAGFVVTTPIQEARCRSRSRARTSPGQSQTGTGKTAAFLIAAFTRCLRHPAPAQSGPTAPRVLIIAPTRELVVQIEADAHLLGALHGAPHPGRLRRHRLQQAARGRCARAATSWSARRAGSSTT